MRRMDNRIRHIACRPEGTDSAAALVLAQEDFVSLASGQNRVRNTPLSMDAGTACDRLSTGANIGKAIVEMGA